MKSICYGFEMFDVVRAIACFARELSDIRV